MRKKRATAERGGNFRPTRCRYCGCIFIKPSEDWKYKYSRHKQGLHFFCSYSCMENARRSIADRDRLKRFRVRHTDDSSIQDMQDRLMMDRGEMHSLEEWADIYDVDYYRLWEKVIQRSLTVDDAISILLAERKTG